MFIEGRGLLAWWSWLAGGACGVLILLLLVCYCRLMPRQHKSFDEQYLKENHTIKENHVYSSRDSCTVKHAEMGLLVQRQARPSSYAGDARRPPAPPRLSRAATEQPPPPPPAQHAQHDHYASMLEETESGGVWCGAEALKTRSLPAFLRPRPRPRPISATDADTHLLHSQVSVSKKHKNRMRSEHAAIIALSKSHGQLADRDRDAVIVYDQRTQL